MRKDPTSAAARGNLAGELTMTAYAKVLAREDVEAALELSRRALKMDRALVAADANNTEAPQNLAYDYYVIGRAKQLQRDAKTAAENYRQSIALLERLTSAHPDNVETAYDLARSRRASRRPKLRPRRRQRHSCSR